MNNQVLPDGVTLIDRYYVSHYLAAGGMQEVYACYDRALNRPVVVKTPKGGVADRRFRRGAEMGAKISHHTVAATFDYYEDDKLTFMVEEFVAGVDLGKRLDTEFLFLDPSLAAHVIHNIARALYEAHRVGICHRDLKPSNVMTSPDPGMSVVKLTDFGIAKLAEGQIAVEMELFDRDHATLTTSNTLLGAVPYLAPECWANWKTAGQPADIWALGCIAYQLATSAPPFGYGRQAIANVIQAEHRGVMLSKPSPFGKHPSTSKLEDEFWDLIVRCIQVDPLARPSAREVLDLCNAWCYSLAERRRGTVDSFGVRYQSGGVSKSGYIQDHVGGAAFFFHWSEFFGAVPPKAGQTVNFSVYPGHPRPRAAPVLLLK